MEEHPTQSHEVEMEGEEQRGLPEPDCELRLVLLGWAGSGKSSVGNAILGFKAFESRLSADSEKPVTLTCEKKAANVAGKKVAIIDTPDWFYSERPPEEVHCQLSLCQLLSAPGPHAFLLCVPVHRPNQQDLQALDALEKVFGPESVSKHTLVLFTHTEHLSKGLLLEEYLSSEREDLQEVVAKCGERYHVLRLRGGEGEQEEEEEKALKSVEELLEKVEELVNESREEFYTFPPLEHSGLTGIEGIEERDLSDEIVCRKRKGGDEEERSGEVAEDPVDGLEVVEDEDVTLSPALPPPSFLRWLWDSVVEWVMWVPSLLRGSTLLGSFVGLFVGGVFGGVMGATVGSVATEVGRRKPQKAKSK